MASDYDTVSLTGTLSGGTSVAVTGANGFVGSAITKGLSAKGMKVRALSRQRPDDLPVETDWMAAPDLDEDSIWGPLLAGCSAVIHCAARVHMMDDRASDPLSEFRRVNCAGTLKLARDAAVAGVERFVFISSIKVNGEQTPPDKPFRASDPPGPVDPYGVSKLEAEDALFGLATSSGMQVSVIRPVLVYGPGVRANFAALMGLVARGIPLPFGAIRNKRSMVYVGNLADLATVVAFHPDAKGQIFLVSDGDDLSTADLVRKLAVAMGRAPRQLPVPLKLLELPAKLLGKGAIAQRLFGSLTVDLGPTRERLSWKPPFSVDEGIAATVQAFSAARTAAE